MIRHATRALQWLENWQDRWLSDCTLCGWRGPTRATMVAADLDGVEHNRAMNS